MENLSNIPSGLRVRNMNIRVEKENAIVKLKKRANRLVSIPSIVKKQRGSRKKKIKKRLTGNMSPPPPSSRVGKPMTRSGLKRKVVAQRFANSKEGLVEKLRAWQDAEPKQQPLPRCQLSKFLRVDDKYVVNDEIEEMEVEPSKLVPVKQMPFVYQLGLQWKVSEPTKVFVRSEDPEIEDVAMLVEVDVHPFQTSNPAGSFVF